MLKLLTFSIFIGFAFSASIDAPVRLERKVVDIPLAPFNPNATEVGDGDDNTRGGRISGGKSAVDGQFPFINEINTYKSGTNGYALCTGAFLTTSWTLTALHCTMADTPEWDPIYILYGTASRSSPYRMTVGVNALVHWGTDARLDIALLRHEYPIQLGSCVGLAQLPPLSMENSFYNGYTATQAGYGAGKDLQYQQLTLNSNFAGCPSTTGFEKNGICLQSKTGTSGAEGGDSGSPIFIYENSKPTIVGVLWGVTSPNNLQLATRISSFIRILSETVGLPLRA